jgi:hypothetical protein
VKHVIDNIEPCAVGKQRRLKELSTLSYYGKCFTAKQNNQKKPIPSTYRLGKNHINPSPLPMTKQDTDF